MARPVPRQRRTTLQGIGSSLLGDGEADGRSGRERSGSAGRFPGLALEEGEGRPCVSRRGGDEARPSASRPIAGGGAGRRGHSLEDGLSGRGTERPRKLSVMHEVEAREPGDGGDPTGRGRRRRRGTGVSERPDDGGGRRVRKRRGRRRIDPDHEAGKRRLADQRPLPPRVRGSRPQPPVPAGSYPRFGASQRSASASGIPLRRA